MVHFILIYPVHLKVIWAVHLKCCNHFIFSWLTLGIVPLVWYHRISARIGRELARRGIQYDFGASDFWLWHVLGSLIIVGPFIYIHKFMHSMNLLNADYNQKG